ncbi:cytochrome B6 [Oceanidesulfovibrio indonesiensis]|uniref:Cytochrome B6 n=1 Tax=Oceanidesulfovibrio indonesiensis TaxID=54767 RepID=A0A7M3MAY6_9BACT|nr:cytochrome B6 [Oceanidesulfovibrio indonesiensis]TVM14601.1 cytochrome B6 [Oceanidesulfovibrio indonesiensis]
MRLCTRHLLIVVCLASLIAASPVAARAQDKDTKPLAPHERMGIPEDVDPIAETYMPVVIEKDFETIMEQDVADKPDVMKRQQELLERRYDLSDNPSDVMMSAGRKAVQQGVRVKLPEGMTWDKLAEMPPEEIKEKELFPRGFLPLPHVKHAVGGQVFPQDQIDEIQKLEQRSLERFDVDFDIPEHFLPEFPPPIFLTTRPDLGDVSQGKLLSIDNYYEIMNGILTPVQMEGLRLLLTPFPQQQFNQTEDRKVEKPSLGVSCLDCHANGHTNGAFHLNPDTRPQVARLRLDTVSLRGMFNQQIHGSKRSLRSIEDFTEFEQRTAYFDGDHVIAAKKGVNLPDRASQVAMMAQMQNIFNFPPAPKLDVFGKLIPEKATESELKGQELFFGDAKCGECHPAPFYLDDKMHDLQVERFYNFQMINGEYIIAEGPIKTFTLRGIKDSPPYLHDGRLLTLEDTVEFFALVTGVKLNAEQKKDLTAFMRAL